MPPSDALAANETPDYIPGVTPPQVRVVLRRRLTLWPLVMVMFFSVSGGAFGLEPAVSESGAGLTLLLLLAVPLLWSLPVGLMVGELSTAMPVEGGYYAWVKKGLGPFWGFQEGWWSWINSFIDMAIYPVLFASYLDTFLTRHAGTAAVGEHEWLHWVVTLVVIWPLTWLNVRGARQVGFVSLWFSLLVLLPFLALSAIGLVDLVRDRPAIWQPVVADDTSLLSAFGLGLFVIMWNYLGWDGPSTVLGEVHTPRRTFPRALTLAVPLVVIAYVLPVVAGLTAVPGGAAWQDGAFSDIAEAVGGAWLGVWLSLAGMVSAAGLFAALLLSNSRLPFVLAADGYLPPALTRLHVRFGTPVLAIVLSSAVYSIFTLSAFERLIELDVILYAASLFLEFAALIALRRREPRMVRPVRVPGGMAGLVLVSLAPVAVFALAVAGTVHDTGWASLALPVAMLASGPLLYPLLRATVKRGTRDVPVPIERLP